MAKYRVIEEDEWGKTVVDFDWEENDEWSLRNEAWEQLQCSSEEDKIDEFYYKTQYIEIWKEDSLVYSCTGPCCDRNNL